MPVLNLMDFTNQAQYEIPYKSGGINWLFNSNKKMEGLNTNLS